MVENLDLQVQGDWVECAPLLPYSASEYITYSYKLKNQLDIYNAKVISEKVDVTSASASFKRFIASFTQNNMAKRLINGADFKPRYESKIGRIGRDSNSILTGDGAPAREGNALLSYSLFADGLISKQLHPKSRCSIKLPDYSRMVTDCSKM